MKTKTVYVEQNRAAPGPSRENVEYRVVRTKGTTRPRLEEILSEEEVSRLIRDGYEVIIDLPRRR